MEKLITRNELADMLGVSTRTIDRWRSRGLDLGEFRAYPRALPRFDPEKVRQAVDSRGFGKAKKKRPEAEPAQKRPPRSNDGSAVREREELLKVLAG